MPGQPNTVLFWHKQALQDKSNEISAIPALLELLDIQGCIVTLDAIGTQKEIARQIQSAQADYILTLKANHPTLFQQVDSWLQTARANGTLPTPCERTTEAGHHRTEIRQVWTVSIDLFPSLHQADQWAGLQTIVVVERTPCLNLYKCGQPSTKVLVSGRVVTSIKRVSTFV